jgi:hypothetical protein
MATTEVDNFSFYISIVASVCLFISEALPYVKAVKSNGIFQVLADTAKQLVRTPSQPSSSNIDDKLLSSDNTIIECLDDVDKKLDVIIDRIDEIKDIYKKDISNMIV